MASERVLITGITGFVAPYIAKKLVDKDYQVTGLQLPRADFGKSKRLKAMGITSDIHIITGDVTILPLSSLQFSARSLTGYFIWLRNLSYQRVSEIPLELLGLIV